MRTTIRLAALLAALVAAPAATAHVDLRPGLVEPDSTPTLTFTVPNDEQTAGTITGFSVEVPANALVLAVETSPGWQISQQARRVRWTGGRIPYGQYVEFRLRLGTPAVTGSIELTSRTTYASGAELRIPLPLVLAPASRPAATSARDEGARTLGKAGLGVALAAAVLALGAGFLGLWLWLRRPE
jgi:hypothetical protein